VSIDVGYKAPSVKSDDIWTLDILSNILSGGESSRLHQALVYDQQIALSASASYRAGLEPGLFEFYVEMKPGHTADEAEKALYAEIQRLATDGPTERELQKARNQSESGFIAALKTNNGAGQALGFFEHVHGDYKQFFTAIDHYRTVTGRRLPRVAQQVFDANRRTRRSSCRSSRQGGPAMRPRLERPLRATGYPGESSRPPGSGCARCSSRRSCLPRRPRRRRPRA
jgi:predicted Zn-dependent peptidase